MKVLQASISMNWKRRIPKGVVWSKVEVALRLHVGDGLSVIIALPDRQQVDSLGFEFRPSRT